jgi:phage-related protein
VPRTKLIYYAEQDGTVPMVQWLTKLPHGAYAKSQAYLRLLEADGHELRRPIADYLRDGIHELRPSIARVHYRILYFFHGSEAVVISHGLTKEGKVPGAEIDRAIERMARFRANPLKHTFIRAKGE